MRFIDDKWYKNQFMEYKKLLHMQVINMSSITTTHMGPYLDLFMIMENSKRMVLKV